MASNCGPPSPNTDISGIGVRVSFYLQTVFLALLSVRSPSADDTTNALSTLIITNLAYAVTTLSLGFKEQPELNLYDASIVLSLLSISWLTVFFAMPQYNRFKQASTLVKILAIGQSYFLIIFAFTILAASPSFGSSPECNAQMIIVIFFVPIKFNKARTAGLVLLSVATLMYTGMLINDYNSGHKKHAKANPTGNIVNDPSALGSSKDVNILNGVQFIQMPQLPHRRGTSATAEMKLSPSHRLAFSDRGREERKFDGRIVVLLIVIISFSTASIINTELLRIKNKIQGQDGGWSFGQILPMFLTFLPFANTIQVFRKHGLSPRTPHGRRKQKRTILSRVSTTVSSERPGSSKGSILV